MTSVEHPPPESQERPTPGPPTQIEMALADARLCAVVGVSSLTPHREAWAHNYYGGDDAFRASPAGLKAFYGMSAHAELEAAVKAIDYALERTPA